MIAACPEAELRITGVPQVLRCGPGDTLLLTGLRAGLDLPYECASGGCGTCTARLVEGVVEPLWAQAPGLSERSRRRGDRVLLCQSRARTACAVRLPVPPGPAADTVPRPSRLPAVVASRRMLGPDTALVTLDCGGPVPYLAGQFVLVELPDGTRRAYSMTCAPEDAEPGALELLVRAKPGGAATRWFFGPLAEGDAVTVEGPFGRAFAQSPPDRPVVCVGGGSGLGQVLAVAGRCLTEVPARPVCVYVGTRSEEDVVLIERLGALHERGADIVVAVERADGGGPSRPWGPSRAGRVVEVLAAHRPDLTAHDVYAAGPEPMIDALLAATVRAERACADRVFFDRFWS